MCGDNVKMEKSLKSTNLINIKCIYYTYEPDSVMESRTKSEGADIKQRGYTRITWRLQHNR